MTRPTCERCGSGIRGEWCRVCGPPDAPTPAKPPEPEEVLKRHYPLSYSDPRIDNEEPIKIGALNMLATLEWAKQRALHHYDEGHGLWQMNVLVGELDARIAELRKKVDG